MDQVGIMIIRLMFDSQDFKQLKIISLMNISYSVIFIVVLTEAVCVISHEIFYSFYKVDQNE